ncbi:MAG TPA: DNA polymerase III subunit delta [bacterium]|nr:DNA polymerase III subunit delta [bacterium]
MTRTKRLARVHLIFGDNEFLVDDRAQEVVSEIKQAVGSDLTIDTVDCEEADLAGVIEELVTPSLFSVNKATVLHHFKLAAENKLARELERCLASDLAPGEHLVIVAEKVDKRLKLAKLIAEEGDFVEVLPLDPAGLRTWILDRFRREGKTASPGVPELLLDLKGDDLRALDSEIEKLVTYAGDEPKVTADDLQAVVGRSRADRIFDLVRYLLERKLAKALVTIADMLDAGESGIGMITYIGREVRALIQIRVFLSAEPGIWDRGMKFPEFAREVLPRFKAWTEGAGIAAVEALLHQKPYAVYRRFLEAEHCDLRALLRMLVGLLEANRLIVNTSVSDKVALETFVSALEAR